MSRSRGSRDSNWEFKLILDKLPETVCRLPPEVSFKPVKDLMRGVVDYPDNMRLDVGLTINNVMYSDKAMCPFRDEADAWDAYYKIDKHVWHHEGYQTVLMASLYLYNKTTGEMEWLAGPRLDGAKTSMSVSYHVNCVPAGTIHAHPPIRLLGSIRGNRRSANQWGRGPPRSTPGHALDPTQTNFMPPPPAFDSPEADSLINTGIIPASQLSPCAAGSDPYPQYLGQAPPYLCNSPSISSTSRSSSISTRSNTHLASCGSNYVILTDDGTTSNLGTPYAFHNASTSSERSHAYPGKPTNPLGQSGLLATSQGTTRDEGYKIIIRDVPPGVAPKQLSKLLNERMTGYVQHKEPKHGEDNKWSVTFSKREDANKAVERLRGFVFHGKQLRVILDTEKIARRQTSSGDPTSTTRGPTIIDGSLPG